MQVSFFVNHRCNLRADKRFLHFFAHPRLAENGGISPKIATGALDSYVRQQYNAGRRHFILYYFFCWSFEIRENAEASLPIRGRRWERNA
jgi:hypothetical protein